MKILTLCFPLHVTINDKFCDFISVAAVERIRTKQFIHATGQRLYLNSFEALVSPIYLLGFVFRFNSFEVFVTCFPHISCI